MAKIKAQATGNWSAAGTWSGGVLPGVGDEAYANGFTVTINQDITLTAIHTDADVGIGAAGGGNFTFSTTRAITCNVIAGTSNCLSSSGTASATIVGDITGGASANAWGFIHTGSGALTIIGNVTGGSGNSSQGLYINSSAVISLTGNSLGGAGGAGIFLTAGSVLTHTGNSTAGTAANGILMQNGAVGSATVIGTVYASNNMPAIDNTNNSGGMIYVYYVENHSNGRQALSGRVNFANASSPQIKIYKLNTTSAILSDPADMAGQVPVATDVRYGTIYLNGQRTGSLRVPIPAAVGAGVLTDNTVGTAALTAATIGAAVVAAILADDDNPLNADQLAAAILALPNFDPDTMAGSLLTAIINSNTDLANRLKNVVTDQVLSAELTAALS